MCNYLIILSLMIFNINNIKTVSGVDSIQGIDLDHVDATSEIIVDSDYSYILTPEEFDQELQARDTFVNVDETIRDRQRTIIDMEELKLSIRQYKNQNLNKYQEFVEQFYSNFNASNEFNIEKYSKGQANRLNNLLKMYKKFMISLKKNRLKIAKDAVISVDAFLDTFEGVKYLNQYFEIVKKNKNINLKQAKNNFILKVSDLFVVNQCIFFDVRFSDCCEYVINQEA